MIPLDPLRAARDAVAANPARPATAVLHDSPDAPLLVFRLAPGQCAAGDVVVYAPDERHAMRAESEELLRLATITPRPGAR